MGILGGIFSIKEMINRKRTDTPSQNNCSQTADIEIDEITEELQETTFKMIQDIVILHTNERL